MRLYNRGKTFRESGGTMKVSNGINVTRIYQDQLKKAQSAKINGENFSSLLKNNSVDAENKSVSAPTVRFGSNAGLNFGVNTTEKAEEADPVEVFKHATEVFTSSEAENSTEALTREARVNEIKALYEAGSYNISAEAVAEKLWASGAVTAVW